MQHGQRRMVVSPFGPFVDPLDRRPPSLGQHHLSKPDLQIARHIGGVPTQLVGIQQRLSVTRNRFALLAHKRQCHITFVCGQQGQPSLARQILRGAAASALRQRLHGNCGTAIAQAANRIGQTVIEQIVTALQQRNQARHLRIQQRLRRPAARRVHVLGQAPDQTPLLPRRQAPPAIAIELGAQRGDRLGLQRRFARHALDARSRTDLDRESALRLQHVPSEHPLLQITLRALHGQRQRDRQGRERAVIHPLRQSPLELCDLQRHHVPRGGIVAEGIQRHHAQRADAFVGSLNSGQYGLSNEVHAAGIGRKQRARRYASPAVHHPLMGMSTAV